MKWLCKLGLHPKPVIKTYYWQGNIPLQLKMCHKCDFINHKHLADKYAAFVRKWRRDQVRHIEQEMIIEKKMKRMGIMQ